MIPLCIWALWGMAWAISVFGIIILMKARIK
jgi:hypothetical protein